MPSELRIISPPVGPTRPTGAGSPRPEPPGEGNAPLSKRQIIALMIEARAAFKALLAAGRIAKGHSFDGWRREAMHAVVRKSSLKLCNQRHFMPLLAWFQDHAGEPGHAVATHIHADGNPKRVAMYKLAEACREKGVSMGYPAAICRAQFKCSLDEATHKQIWNLVFTVRNRREGATARRKARRVQAQGTKAAPVPAAALPAKLIIRRPARAPKPAATPGELPF